MRKVALDVRPEEYQDYQKGYIEKGKLLAKEMDLLQHGSGTVQFLKSIPDEKYSYRYDSGKWSIKEIIAHCSDAERVFAYRAMRFARKDRTELPGFDENDYVVRASAGNRKMEDIMEEFISVRVASHHLFESFDDEVMRRVGVASGKPQSVRSLYLILFGHVMHHLAVIKERYLGPVS